MKWGGYVFTLPSDNASPQMGSGQFDNGIYLRTSYLTNVLYLDDHNQLVRLPNDIQTAESCCYLEGDESYTDNAIGYTSFFGGKDGTQYECT